MESLLITIAVAGNPNGSSANNPHASFNATTRVGITEHTEIDKYIKEGWQITNFSSASTTQGLLLVTVLFTRTSK